MERMTVFIVRDDGIVHLSSRLLCHLHHLQQCHHLYDIDLPDFCAWCLRYFHVCPLDEFWRSIYRQVSGLSLWPCDWLCDRLCDWLCDWFCDWLCDWFCDWLCEWFCDWLCEWFCDKSKGGSGQEALFGFQCECVAATKLYNKKDTGAECTW